MANKKEAQARIKINKLLENANWRFFDSEAGVANIQLEPNVKLSKKKFTDLGNNFQAIKHGFVDFLLLDDKGFPFVVLEAKSEDQDPLDGKEQARTYAQSLNVRFIILSNGNAHYFWDMKSGNPEVITEFPTQDSISHRHEFQPNKQVIADEEVNDNYIALTQDPRHEQDPRYKNESTRADYISDKNLPILRPYQLAAIHALQKSAASGNDRFLFEMATGTGKTMISAAIIKLFLRTGNAKRILFLVDRLELEKQAHKNFVKYLRNDCITVTYKENKDDWQKAEIVISTVQSLTSQDKYKKLFSPTDFELVISDEAHRSINGNSRAVFEYFIGYKLGLTATPKDYLKHIDVDSLATNDPRSWERRQLLDTYTTFGCAGSEPTFRYSLSEGVKDGYLINPIVVDARTDITTEILSEQGYSVMIPTDEGEEVEAIFSRKDFEKKLFSERTNDVLCRALIENALPDPISNELGKTIAFCVSQKHASKVTQILNQIADKKWPGMYNSNFAVQVTSNINDAQQLAMGFANNNLNGHTIFLPEYKTTKTRVCVTVGMMTTGYDCEDILNLALLRPVFSPTDFVQIKGRGTRKFNFEYKNAEGQYIRNEKQQYKFLDFFASFEYFENDFKYDEAIPLAASLEGEGGGTKHTQYIDELEIFDPDKIRRVEETTIGFSGMKVDRKLFQKAQDKIINDKDIKEAFMDDNVDLAIQLLRDRYEDKPELYITLEKLRTSEDVNWRITWNDVLERMFGIIECFPTREEKLDEEVAKFVAIHKPDSGDIPSISNYIKAYISDPKFREIIDAKSFPDLNTYPGFSMGEFRELKKECREKIPEYIKDYVVLNTYIC